MTPISSILLSFSHETLEMVNVQIIKQNGLVELALIQLGRNKNVKKS
jgi:hypothetical protein